MTITLYRGDYSKIKEFEFHKTSKWCYRGQGVYLTDKQSVADTYRTKGGHMNLCHTPIIFDGGAKDRMEAYDKAFVNYIQNLLGEYLRHETLNNPGKMLQLRRKYYDQYQRDIDSGAVRAEYTGCIQRSDGRRVIVVKHQMTRVVGHLSEFKFGLKDFNTSIMKIDGLIEDRFFWELVYQNRINYGEWKDDDTLEQFVDRNAAPWRLHNYGRGAAVAIASIPKKNRKRVDVFASLRKVLTPYGIRGFEYNGGVNTGSVRHRAFVVWDMEWVNDHRVY